MIFRLPDFPDYEIEIHDTIKGRCDDRGVMRIDGQGGWLYGDGVNGREGQPHGERTATVRYSPPSLESGPPPIEVTQSYYVYADGDRHIAILLLKAMMLVYAPFGAERFTDHQPLERRIR